MRYVTCHDGLWKMTNRQWKFYLQQWAAHQTPEVPGTHLGNTENVTDINLERAKFLLEEERRYTK